MHLRQQSVFLRHRRRCQCFRYIVAERRWWDRGFSRARTSVVHVILAIGVFLLEVGRHLGFEKQAQRDCRDSRPCAFLPFEQQQQHIGVCHEDAEDA